jgi:hypothetical protein
MKVAIFLLFFVLFFAKNSFAQDVTFTKYLIDNIGSILIPSIMEKQDQNDNSNIFHSTIFQQKGLNQKKQKFV